METYICTIEICTTEAIRNDVTIVIAACINRRGIDAQGAVYSKGKQHRIHTNGYWRQHIFNGHIHRTGLFVATCIFNGPYYGGKANREICPT